MGKQGVVGVGDAVKSFCRKSLALAENSLESPLPPALFPPAQVQGVQEGDWVVPLQACVRQNGVPFPPIFPVQVQGVREGDWVVPLQACMGTWRQHGVFPASAFHRIAPECIPVEAAASLCIKWVGKLCVRGGRWRREEGRS